MTEAEKEALVREVLAYKPNPLSQFVVNEPGLRLIQKDGSFLKAIEDAILDTGKGDGWKEVRALSYVIGAYLVIATKYAPESMVGFINSLPAPMIREVIANIPIFLGKNTKDGKYRFSVGPTPDLMALVKKFTSSDDRALRNAAMRVLRFV